MLHFSEEMNFQLILYFCYLLLYVYIFNEWYRSSIIQYCKHVLEITFRWSHPKFKCQRLISGFLKSSRVCHPYRAFSSSFCNNRKRSCTSFWSVDKIRASWASFRQCNASWISPLLVKRDFFWDISIPFRYSWSPNSNLPLQMKDSARVNWSEIFPASNARASR